MLRTKLPQVILHLGIWLIFISLPLLFLANQPGSGVNLSGLLTYRYFWLFNFSFAFLFYFNTYFLIPRLYLNRKPALYGLVILLLLTGFIFLKPFHLMVSRGRLLPPAGMNQPRFEPRFGPGAERPGPPFRRPEGFHFDLLSCVFFVMVVALGLALQSMRRWLTMEQRMLQMETEKAKAEAEKANAQVSFLKAQINPHFLFNTLNSIYALAIIKSDDTATAVVKLSGMMRYLVSETQQEFVSLEKEIAYINDYFDLQKMRLGNTIDFAYGLEGDFIGKQIAPLILISFVENAFKYGVNPEENSRIRIKISLSGQALQLLVKNNKVKTTVNETEQTGLGISNTRHRLELLYPGWHQLEITDTANEFTVNLKLNLA